MVAEEVDEEDAGRGSDQLDPAPVRCRC